MPVLTVFIDTEIGIEDKKIHDIGAIRSDSCVFHSASLKDFYLFIKDADYICGHNIIHHDLQYLRKSGVEHGGYKIIDTLYLSPLLFPKKPYHKLLKDDKIQTEALNNPVNDCKKAVRLFFDELNAFAELSIAIKQIFYYLLHGVEEFSGFFQYVNFKINNNNIHYLIKTTFKDRICANVDLNTVIKENPVELAYALALINTNDQYSITPPWILKNFPETENIIKLLCGVPCKHGCPYCNNLLDVNSGLKNIFGYEKFRTFEGEPLQENAARAAVEGKSLIAVFPTGGGKSITFQLPALMAGKTVRGLTVVISPLQSLMKDQVDNLNNIGITDAVTINGLLDPIERADAFKRVSNGSASILYISPEQLRSRTVEKVLLNRNVVRFVIDEAHCFSAWGQDFRVDYLYIGDFISNLQKKKFYKKMIPVSCFTATAKQKVITDICEYFKRKLNLDLEIFASTATRKNLHYTVLYQETDEQKYNTLRSLIAAKNCPTIVYVSRTKRTRELADKLTSDGFPARAFNGKMEVDTKIINQEDFMNNKVKIMVATSAFGMGVDKKDVKLVVHYDISGSLEDYVQEAGRAGRDPNMQAECFVLYNDNDLDKHFILLNQTKLSISEIQQVWRAIKNLTKNRSTICCSALEIARYAGWEETITDVEMRVKSAIAALENAGYIKRGRNVPHVYATSILSENMQDAAYRIDTSNLYSDKQKQQAKRIIKSLLSKRSVAKAQNDDAESRIDYLADMLAMTKEEVIGTVNLMRQDGLLADEMDMSAFILSSDTENKSKLILDKFAKLEQFIINKITEDGTEFNLKELNEEAQNEKIPSANVKNIKTVLYYNTIKNFLRKEAYGGSSNIKVFPTLEIEKLQIKIRQRQEICHFILEYLYAKAKNIKTDAKDERAVQFSVVSLFNTYNKRQGQLDMFAQSISLMDIEDALLYLSKIGAIKMEGGFLVLYNGMEVKRIVKDNRIQYKQEDYRFLDEFYKQRIRQIHIVGEYANLMVRNYEAALQFVKDYFQLDFRNFITKYFQEERLKEIDRNITPKKYHQLFSELSEKQSEIINDAESKYIVVAAGPGSGKTRVLVHKLASLLLLEDVKHEQLLMLTFSRSAATEFKKRLIDLIGNAANFVEIKTFHSYCFDLLGKIGSLEGVDEIIKNAAAMIRNGEVEPGKITKSVLVIDEAQDMDQDEYDLVQALMQINTEMRVIAVGDDDQNIYAFRGSDSKYLSSFVAHYGATKYEMIENYRSKLAIVDLANSFVNRISHRMKCHPCESVQNEIGKVIVTHHKSQYMEELLVEQLIKNRNSQKCCVLTQTNEEALQILGLLTKKNINAKLIQSLEGFKLYNLAEIRYFLRKISRDLTTPVIPDTIWNQAKNALFSAYAESKCMEICRNLIRDFEKTNSVKYHSDFIEFIKESQYEDFYDDENEAVYISTIHKAKGREFDSVYMLLNNCNAYSDAEKRKLYVGMTRAKNELYIHCNTNLFDSYKSQYIQHNECTVMCEEAKEISIQLTHKDVFLDFFKNKKDCIFKLRSGNKLRIDNNFLVANINGKLFKVVKFSKAFVSRIERLSLKGYHPINAYVNFIVAWKAKDDESETAIILPLLDFKKY